MSVEQLLTAEQLWEMPEKPGVRYELVDGRIIEMSGAGGLHNLLVSFLYKLIDAVVSAGDMGQTFTDNTGYILRSDPDLVRIPDVSFISWDRLPEDGVPEGFIRGAPNPAVEIMSPHDRANDVHDKVAEYPDAETEMVWILWPKHRSVSIHEPSRIARKIGQSDELDGCDVVPAFHVSVEAIFAVRRRR